MLVVARRCLFHYVGLQVSVNEAAAQICRLVPAMLTRRDELFPLARQVVRDSGYQYSKGHSRSVQYSTVQQVLIASFIAIKRLEIMKQM